MKRFLIKMIDHSSRIGSMTLTRLRGIHPRRVLPAVAASAIATMLSPGPASARVSWQKPIDFRQGGAYGIVHYGDAGSRRYIQIYVHDTRADNRCAEIWADFSTVDKTGHYHIDPVRAIVCGHGRKAWSRRYYVKHQDDGGAVNGVNWVDACWRTRHRRNCARGIADTNGYVRADRFDTIPLRGD